MPLPAASPAIVTLLLTARPCAVDVVTVALPDPTTIFTSFPLAIDHVVVAMFQPPSALRTALKLCSPVPGRYPIPKSRGIPNRFNRIPVCGSITDSGRAVGSALSHLINSGHAYDPMVA